MKPGVRLITLPRTAGANGHVRQIRNNRTPTNSAMRTIAFVTTKCAGNRWLDRSKQRIWQHRFTRMNRTRRSWVAPARSRSGPPTVRHIGVEHPRNFPLCASVVPVSWSVRPSVIRPNVNGLSSLGAGEIPNAMALARAPGSTGVYTACSRRCGVSTPFRAADGLKKWPKHQEEFREDANAAGACNRIVFVRFVALWRIFAGVGGKCPPHGM